MEDQNEDTFVESSNLIENADDKDKEFIELAADPAAAKPTSNGHTPNGHTTNGHTTNGHTTNGHSNGHNNGGLPNGATPTSNGGPGLQHHENNNGGVPNGDSHHHHHSPKEQQPDIPDIPFSKKKILKNIFVGCTAFVFLFTPFQAISNLQTSLNREEGIGSISLSLVYASIILSCFLPKFLIARLGCKLTMALSMLGYIIYISANFYAVKATMFTAAIFVGIAAAPLWTAKFTYLTQSGVWYAKLTNQDKEVVINRFFGFFWLFTQSCQIWGNLVASLVFTPTPSGNETSSDSSVCGAQFCGGNVSGNFEQDKEKVFTALGIYVGCSVVALIIVFALMDPIRLDNNDTEENKKLNPKLLLATFRHLFRSPIQMMLVAITIYGGMEKAFISGEFTQAYISCSLGIWNLGYVMICYGVVGALCSLLFGNLVKYIGRIPFFVLLLFVHGGLLIGLLVWEPQRDQEVLFYVIAGLWGVGSMVISTQLNALYGEFFTENSEAAFSNFRLWEAIGFAVTYAYNNLLCTDIKIYICMALLVVGMIGYGAAEVTFRVNKKRKPATADDEAENTTEMLVNGSAENTTERLVNGNADC